MRTRRTDPRNGDPRLKTRQWQAIVNAWNRLQPQQCEATHCLLPGTPITYTTPRTPTSLDVGHKTPRNTDTRRTWTIDDTRPEHATCNRTEGTTIRIANNTPKQIPKTEQAKSAQKC